MEDKNVDFVAKHYRKGAFSAEKALHRMGFAVRNRWKPLRIAASVAAVVAVTAVASVIIHNEYAAKEQPSDIVIERPAASGDVKIVRSIDFDDVPLPVVVEEIRKVYGVEVTGLPEEAGSYRLTLHYEGNVKDLIATINEILDTKLSVIE